MNKKIFNLFIQNNEAFRSNIYIVRLKSTRSITLLHYKDLFRSWAVVHYIG